ncbi:MAG: hypothetical protein ACREVY_15385 [Gammaproteobacteria bacterium]
MPAITASTLYNLVICPHRVAMDCFEDPAKRDPIRPFVQLLWERGTKYEQEVISELKLSFTNLKDVPAAERVIRTLEAMGRRKRSSMVPTLSRTTLSASPTSCEKRLAATHLSISSLDPGKKAIDSSKPKEHYAVQLGLYLVVSQFEFRLPTPYAQNRTMRSDRRWPLAG